MPRRIFNVGIIGCGGIAKERHIPSWRKNIKARVIAVADINESRGKKVAKSFHIPKHYADYKRMLEKERSIEITRQLDTYKIP